MAKVNNIKINGTTRYIENISYQTALPTATSDSADFVSVNNELYAKQVNNGVYSYAKVGGAEKEIIVVDESWYVFGPDEEITLVIPEEYRDFERLKNATLINFGRLLTVAEINEDDIVFREVRYFPDGASGSIDAFDLIINVNDWSVGMEGGSVPHMIGNDTSGYFDEIHTAKNPLRTLTLTPFENAQVQPYGVAITDVPATATNGTLTQDQLEILQASDSNYIMFNNEKYYLNDKGHTEGYLSYSHVGVVSEDIFVKVITITISTRGWVLVEKNVNEPEPPITLVDTLPEANEENFEKGKIYTTGALLQYISKEAVDTPSLGQVNSLPLALYQTSATAVGSDIYIFGGQSNNGIESTIYKYSTTANTITTMSTALPVALFGTSATAVGTDIYIFGGSSSSSRVNTIYKYDTTTNTISTMSTLPRAIYQTSAAAVGTDVYIFGGDYSTFTSTIYKYDTTTNTITTMSTTLPQALSRTSATAVGSDIYIFGGYNAYGSANTIYKYDTTTNTISTMSATLPQALADTSAAVLGTDVYIFGGTTGGRTNYVNTIYKYSTTTDTITTMSTSLPVALEKTSAAAVGTNAYIFGGYRSSVVNTIYQFSLGFVYTFKTLANLDAITNAIETEY